MAGTRTINDAIHGVIELGGVRADLVATPEFNRLCHIKQLGLAHLVFPGAHHTRFEHSLGASHVAGQIADSIGLDAEEKELVQVAGMLHDVGHGPYSHTLEHILHERGGLDHMEVTEGIIMGEIDFLTDASDSIFEDRVRIPEVLESHGIDPKEVADLIRGPDAGGTERSLLEWVEGKEAFVAPDTTLGNIVHGSVDCDQIDYLLRDSHFTGVRHGVIDHHRLIGSLVRESDDLVIKEGGVAALEGMLVARGLMYSAVYFHRVTRVTEIMLSRSVEHTNTPALEMQPMVDAEIWEMLNQGDPVAKEMRTRLKYRRLFKTANALRRDELSPDQISRLIEIASDRNLRLEAEARIAQRVGLNDYEVAIDVPSVKLLLSEPRMAKVDVRVLGQDGRLRWFKDHTPVADALRSRQVSENACYVFSDSRKVDEVSQVAPKVLFAEG